MEAALLMAKLLFSAALKTSSFLPPLGLLMTRVSMVSGTELLISLHSRMPSPHFSNSSSFSALMGSTPARSLSPCSEKLIWATNAAFSSCEKWCTPFCSVWRTTFSPPTPMDLG